MCSMGKFGVPINCVLLKHWNKYVFPFWGHSARAQWVNLEVPINCILLEHWYGIFFLFWGACHVCSMGKFGGPHKLCICVFLEHWNLYIFPFLGSLC